MGGEVSGLGWRGSLYQPSVSGAAATSLWLECDPISPGVGLFDFPRINDQRQEGLHRFTSQQVELIISLH